MSVQTNNRFLPIRLLSIESDGFSYLPRQEILLHESITGAIGENGSGKTTFLNMIRVLLGSIRFDNDQSLQTFFERDNIYETYIIAKFDNTLKYDYGKQPFEEIGKYNDVVSVVCRLQLEQSSVKRHYLIFDGEFNLDIDLKGTYRWLKPGQYNKQMEEVGLSRALINAFSLNQGSTEEILKKNPEELAEYLLEICGEQERINNFHNIKSDVNKQKAQYTSLLEQKEIEEVKVQRLQERIERCKKIIQSEEKITQYTFNMPIALFIEKQTKLNEQKKNLKDLEEGLEEINSQIRNYEDKEKNYKNNYDEINSEYKNVNNRIKRLYRLNGRIDNALFKIQTKVSELENFINQYSEITPISQTLLESEKERSENIYRNWLGELRLIEKEKYSIEERIEQLEKNEAIVFPLDIQKMITTLNESKIKHLLLADCIEILDEEWREAIEALLGSERFTIVVSNKDMVKVMKLAQEVKYPFWISPYRNKNLEYSSNSILQKIKILDERVSGYLEHFQDYVISDSMNQAWDWVKKGKKAILNKPYAYKVMVRGGRFIKSNGKYCGKLALKAQLEDSKRELQELLPKYHRVKQKTTEVKLNLDEIITNIEVQSKVRTVPQKERKLKVLRKKQLKRIAFSKKIKYICSKEELRRDEIEKDKILTQEKYISAINLKDQMNKQKDIIILDIDKQGREVYDSEQKLHNIRKKLTDEQKSILNNEPYVAALNSSVFYQVEIDSLKRLIDELRSISGAEYIKHGEEKRMISLEQKYKQYQKSLKQHINEIERVQSELCQLEEKHKIVQEEYHLMVEEVFNKIRYSLEEFCSICNIHADLRAFYVGDDRWKVDYQIGFHGKKPQSYQVKTGFSGGQKVIASLLLTFAAIKSDGSLSFMVLDEPFAHLDHERINLVGEFLKSTGIQFIIAMPYSENIKLFMPWVDMILNFRPKKADKDVAPPITYGVINSEYLEKRNII